MVGEPGPGSARVRPNTPASASCSNAPDRVVEVYAAMLANRVRPTPDVGSELAGALVDAGRTELAEEARREFAKNGVQVAG